MIKNKEDESKRKIDVSPVFNGFDPYDMFFTGNGGTGLMLNIGGRADKGEGIGIWLEPWLRVKAMLDNPDSF